jgi:hypothetical protein
VLLLLGLLLSEADALLSWINPKPTAGVDPYIPTYTSNPHHHYGRPHLVVHVGITEAVIQLTHTVQCDEHLPACTRCVKRGEKCSFLTVPVEQDSPTSHSNSNGTPHDCSAEQHVRQLLELELMHHWTTSTYKTMEIERPDLARLMTIDLPRSALKHEYLLDGIFSLTALHLAHEHQADPHTSDYYIAAAMSCRERGMQRAAPAIQEINQIDYQPEASEVFAMFWFSAIAGMVTMALTVLTRREPSNFASPDHPTGRAFINMQVEIAQLWRGTRVIMEVASSMPAKVYTGAEPVVQEQSAQQQSALDSETEAALSQLEVLITKPVSGVSDSEAEDDHTELYRHSATLIRKAFESDAATGSLDDTMAVGATLGNDFAILLKEGAPRALLSTLCYGTILDKVSRRWWAGDTGRMLVHECSGELIGCSEEWQPLIRWARAKVGLPDPTPGSSGPSDPPSVG